MCNCQTKRRKISKSLYLKEGKKYKRKEGKCGEKKENKPGRTNKNERRKASYSNIPILTLKANQVKSCSEHKDCQN